MKKAKEDGKSNMNSRFFGASIGIITAVPVALSATMLSTVVSPTNDFTKTVSAITTGLTGGQAKDTDKEIKEAVKIADAATALGDPDVIEGLKAAFGAGSSLSTTTPLTSSDQVFKDLQKLLKLKLVTNSLDSLLKTANVDTSKVAFKPIPTKHVFATPVVTTQKDKDRITEALTSKFSTYHKDDIEKYLVAIGLF